MPHLGSTELLILLAVLVLLFGARRLPELARGTGQALRIFKTEIGSDRADDVTDLDVAPPVEHTPTP